MLERDAMILGSGLAGCSAAVKLAALGHRVIVLSRSGDPKPSPRIETIHDPALLASAFAGYRPGHGTLIDDARKGTSWWNKPKEGASTPPMTVINRAGLDADLIRLVRSIGIELLEAPETPEAHADNEEGQGWTLRLPGRSWHAPVLIDATGRHSALRKRKELVSWKQAAITGEATGDDLPAMWTESLPEGWLWAIQWQEKRWMVSTFADPRRTPRARLIASSRFAGRMVELPGRRWTTDSSPVAAESAFRGSMFHAGDASLSRDPLATQGITGAVSDGMSAATAAHSLLTNQAPYALVQQYLAQRHELAIHRHQRFLAESYRAAPFSTDFWRKRSEGVLPAVTEPRAWLGNLDERLRLSRKWRMEERPVMDADGIRRANCLCSDEEAVSWLGGYAIDDLLRPLQAGSLTGRAMISCWVTKCGIRDSSVLKILRWLTSRQILVPADPSYPQN